MTDQNWLQLKAWLNNLIKESTKLRNHYLHSERDALDYHYYDGKVEGLMQVARFLVSLDENK